MKMKPEHFRRLSTLINQVLDRRNPYHIVQQYETGQFERSATVKDLQKRFCFDLLYDIPESDRSQLMHDLYNYLNDDHIYTALRQCCPVITKRY